MFHKLSHKESPINQDNQYRQYIIKINHSMVTINRHTNDNIIKFVFNNIVMTVFFSFIIFKTKINLKAK